MTDLIYRRLVLLAGAHAQVQPLARAWGVVIVGYVGRNSIKVLETYSQRSAARQRRGLINHLGVALVVSIDEILYPLSLIVAKYSRNQNIPEPPMPPPNKLLEPYTLASDIYKDASRPLNR